MSESECRQKLTWEPAEGPATGGTWRRTARCERPTSHPGPHNGQGYTWGKFGVTPPDDTESRELATLRRYVQHDLAAFGAWCIDNLLSDDCSGCSMPDGRHWDTCPNRWDGRPTR